MFLGTATYVRHGGDTGSDDLAPYLRLMSPDAAQDARVLGLAQRLAYRVSGATAAILERCRLSYDGTALHLALPTDGSAPGGEAVERRLKSLAAALGVSGWKVEG